MYKRQPLKVIGEVNVAVHHNLMNCSGKREDIVEVHAHPQALAQCRIWLMTHLPQAKLVPSSLSLIHIYAHALHFGLELEVSKGLCGESGH